MPVMNYNIFCGGFVAGGVCALSYVCTWVGSYDMII